MCNKCTALACTSKHSKFNNKSFKACQIRLKRKEWCEAAYTPEGCRSNHNFKHPRKGATKTIATTNADPTPPHEPNPTTSENTATADVFMSKANRPGSPDESTPTAGNGPGYPRPPDNPLHSTVMIELAVRMISLPSIRTLNASNKHTRGDIAKALKDVISHAKAETAAIEEQQKPAQLRWQSTCWPCAEARRALERRPPASNLHFNAAIAMTSRPCSVILSELCRRVVDDTTTVTSTDRGACIAAHSIYLSAKGDDDAATQDLHEALLSTVVAQLAAPDTEIPGNSQKHHFSSSDPARPAQASDWRQPGCTFPTAGH